MELAIWAVTTLVLLVIAFYLDAKAGLHFTFLGETGIAFVVRGQEVHKVLIGLRREDSATIRENLERRRILWSDRESSPLAQLGIHYVSVLYPFFRIHTFDVLAEGIKEGGEGREIPKEGALMREWIYHRVKTVNALRWQFPRPVLVENVELADRVTVDIIVMAVLEVEDPYSPVFTFRGDFFPLAASFVESAAIDSVVGESAESFLPPGAEMTYSHFVKIDKGESSPFSIALRDAINTGDATEGKGLPSVLGIRAVKAYIFKYDLSTNQKEVAEASRAEAAERMKARGVVEKARGEAEARRVNAEAEATRFELIVSSLVDKGGVDSNVAADVARTMVKTENVRDSKLTTWVDAEHGLGDILGRRSP